MGKEVLTFSGAIWRNCMAELRQRGRGYHESGCFVLGRVENGKRRAVRCVFYDELDPKAYASGVCILHGSAFPPLWKICRDLSLTVIADIHTHCGMAIQSYADRENPMIARPGHLALIIPNLAEGMLCRHQLGCYRYEGAHRWTNLSGWRCRKLLKIGWCLL